MQRQERGEAAGVGGGLEVAVGSLPEIVRVRRVEASTVVRGHPVWVLLFFACKSGAECCVPHIK